MHGCTNKPSWLRVHNVAARNHLNAKTRAGSRMAARWSSSSRRSVCLTSLSQAKTSCWRRSGAVHPLHVCRSPPPRISGRPAVIPLLIENGFLFQDPSHCSIAITSSLLLLLVPLALLRLLLPLVSLALLSPLLLPLCICLVSLSPLMWLRI